MTGNNKKMVNSSIIAMPCRKGDAREKRSPMSRDESLQAQEAAPQQTRRSPALQVDGPACRANPGGSASIG